MHFDLNNMVINPAVNSSQLRKSHKMSKLSKKRCYGYYVNLCNKYGYNILKRTYFKPQMISEVERIHLAESFTNEIDLN